MNKILWIDKDKTLSDKISSYLMLELIMELSDDMDAYAVGASDAYTKTEYEYNWNGQPTKVKGYNGNSVSSCVQYYYDSVGNVLRMYTGNVNGLKVDGLDNLSGITSNYAVTKYSYDSMNRCVSETDALGQTTSNVYDINGNLTQTTDRNGNVLSYSYDGLNQLLQKSSSKTAEDTYTYSYNKKGLRTEMTGGGTDTVYEYDNLGRLTKESLTDGTVKEYTYDMNGNRKSFKLTKDNTVQYTLTYSYDKLNRLIGMFEDNSLKAQYVYNVDGSLGRSLCDGRITDYKYNLANMITEVNNKKSAKEISKYTYTYYVDGNQQSKSESIAGADKGTTNYTYDGLGRLKSEVLSEKTKSYNYDYYGNRSSMSVTGEGSTSYSYDKNNRLTKQTQTVDGVSNITEYWYDPNGNQISSMSVNNSLKDGNNTVVMELAGKSTNSVNGYNSWNQLTSTMQNGKTASYTYNGDGLRMSKTVDGTTTSHIWDGINIAGDVTNGTVTKYIRGLQLISAKTGSNENFYNYNGHGDVVQLTNSSGNTTKQYSYDAFGVEQDKANNDVNPFRYCGEYYDNESDSVYLRARYYSPVSGMFISEDPIRDGLNWYGYCGNNPVMFVDPWGLEYIVVSGGAYAPDDPWPYEFIAPAIQKINDLREENSTENITWVISNIGYSEENIEEITGVANDLNVNCVFINSAAELQNYINSKDVSIWNLSDARLEDPIRKFVVFSHGVPGSIELGYFYDDEGTFSLGFNWIKGIFMEAFDNPNTALYSCRAGNDVNQYWGSNFAQEWVNLTGGRTWAPIGRTYYENVPKQGILDKIGRKINKISANASYNYPTEDYGEGAYFINFYRSW